MSKFIIFISFFLVIHSIGSTSAKYADHGRPVVIKTDSHEKLHECLVEFNNKPYAIDSKFNYMGVKLWNRYSSCSIEIKNTNFDHAGQWKITSIVIDQTGQKQSRNFTEELIVTQKQAAQPTGNFRGQMGDYVTAYFSHYFENITECDVWTRHSGEYKLIFEKNKNTVDDVRKQNIRCGIQIHISSSSKTWILYQKSGPYKIAEINIDIDIIQKPDSEIVKTLNWMYGSRNQLIGSILSSDVIYCDLELPNGRIITLHAPNCTYEVDTVYSSHAGIWKISFFSSRYLISWKKEIFVKVFGKDNLVISVSEESDDIIKIRATVSYPYQDCGLDCGYTNLEWMHREESSEPNDSNRFTFSRSMHKMECQEYGISWRCLAYHDLNNNINITRIVTAKMLKRKHEIVTTNINVTIGENFILNCNAASELDYCWFVDPHNKIYTLSERDDNSDTSLKITGDTLSIGSCTAIIKNARKQHEGNWSCRLGFTEGIELNSIISVVVTN